MEQNKKTTGIFGAGQRRIYHEGEKAVVFPRAEYDITEIVTDIPPLEIHEKFKEKDYVVTMDVTEKVLGVNSEMIDWWWGNLEKGYLLWAPGEHYGFEWIVPPCEVGYEGSVEASYEFDPVHPMVITRIGMQEYPFTECFSHCWIAEGFLGPVKTMLVHMHEDVPDGIYWRTVQVMTKEMQEQMLRNADKMPDANAHTGYESGRLRYFLPALYALWKDHPDPWQNVHFDLTTKKNEDGTWAHKSKNLPPVF